MKKKFRLFDLVLVILWILIIVSIILNLCFDFQNFILVGLAGLLASASVLKNIKTTKELKQDENKSNQIKNLAYLNFLLFSMKKDLEDIKKLIPNSPNSKISSIDYSAKSYYFLKSKLLDKEVITTLKSDEERTSLKNILLNFEEIKTYIEQYLNHQSSNKMNNGVTFTQLENHIIEIDNLLNLINNKN